MGALSAVRIYNNLSAGEASIAVRSADHELPGWIDVILDIVVEQFAVFLVFRFYAGNQDIDNVLLDPFLHFGFGVKVVVLGRNNDGINSYRTVIIVIFQRYLTFGIRAQVFDLLIFTAKCSQFKKDLMRKIQRKWHVVFCFVIGVSFRDTFRSK